MCNTKCVIISKSFGFSLILHYLCSPKTLKMKELYYKVAEHVFVLKGDGQDDLLHQLSQYEPFIIAPTAEVTFSVEMVSELSVSNFQEELRQEEEGQTIVAGHLDNGDAYFEFWLGKKQCSIMVADKDYHQAKVYVKENWSYGVNNAMMVMYALATANSQTALFHSSVVSYQDKAYMFLGHSGTGKSTHSSLWLKYIEGTELVNDDNPVVRIIDGVARVYGSPWSGKTPCYRNVSYPVGGIVKLDQAPHNEIVRLKGVRAYAAVVPSISGKRWDKRLAEGLHETENLLAQLVPVWHLDCLPDEGAARLCCQNCAHGS